MSRVDHIIEQVLGGQDPRHALREAELVEWSSWPQWEAHPKGFVTELSRPQAQAVAKKMGAKASRFGGYTDAHADVTLNAIRSDFSEFGRWTLQVSNEQLKAKADKILKSLPQ